MNMFSRLVRSSLEALIGAGGSNGNEEEQRMIDRVLPRSDCERALLSVGLTVSRHICVFKIILKRMLLTFRYIMIQRVVGGRSEEPTLCH